MELFNWDKNAGITLILVSLVLYTIYGAIYRLFLSPLRNFPGPSIAALTSWYELYYDLILGGKYTFKLIELHKQYGPIIRITPFELHVSDPEFYDEVYASSASKRKRNKYPLFYKSFGIDYSMFATVDHDLHKNRRAAINPFFSSKNVRELQPVIEERVATMMKRIRDFNESGQVLNVSWLNAAFTSDVVMQYAFARSDHRLERPDFDRANRDGAFFGSTAADFMKHAPWLNVVFQSLPDQIVRLAHPSLAAFLAQRKKQHIVDQIVDIKNGANKSHITLSHATIFHQIIDSKMPEEEKSVRRLSDEAEVLVLAGTLTTALVLDLSTFYLLRKPRALRRLKTELISVRNEASPIVALEHLPYLNAVIKESLRLTYGVAGRLARMPQEPLHFTNRSTGQEWIIPPGTPVGMSIAQLHHDETNFPNSHEWIPERWLNEKGDLDPKLDKYLLSFTRGSRQCLGMHLGYSELYLVLNAIWTLYGSQAGVTEMGDKYEGVRFEGDIGLLDLYKTGKGDVKLHGGSFLPLVKPGSRGIQVKVLD
ncbi:hypothetical protein V496_00043 [Pseudogymnoascus sp. VKM F-4515 (FW-2607)]|nr:hypothetical protein V496_00043 [Pseudogymnoascus sp. VKM F-4515 (FW-2607)]